MSSRYLCSLFLILVAIGPFRLISQSASTSTRIVPVPAQPSVAAGADSWSPFFSIDGRFVFFQSVANDLVSDDASLGTVDLFRYELSSGGLIRVSSESLSSGKPADWMSPVISDDGDVVVFSSLSTALIPEKTNSHVLDIFWKRISTGELRLVSVNTNGLSGGDADSREPAISADGRYVAFESDANNLAPLDAVSVPLGTVRSVVYMRDLEKPHVIAMSVPSTADAVTVSGHAPSLSRDGKTVAFYTKSLGATATATRIVVRDVELAQDLWTYTMGRYTGSDCRGPQFSPDGHRIAFYELPTAARMGLRVHDLETSADYTLTHDFLLCAPIVWGATAQQIAFETFFQLGLWDVETGDIQLQKLRNPVSRASAASWSSPMLDREFSRMVYRDGVALSESQDTRKTPELLLRQLPDGQPTVITVNATGSPSLQEEIGSLALSQDGRWVAFEASDSDLVQGDNNRVKDVFLLDLQTHQIRLLSRHGVASPAATGSGALMGRAALANHNRSLAFAAGDGNYGVGDTNRTVDVFLQDLSSGDLRAITLHQPGFVQPYQRYLSPQLSSSGQVIAFAAYRVNSVDGSGFPFPTELHVLDMSTGARQTLMPADNDLGLNGVPAAAAFHLSANGQRLAFEAHTSTMGAATQILLRDLPSGTNILVSANQSGFRANGTSTRPWVSPDGGRVLFLSDSSDLLPKPVSPSLRRLYQWDLDGRTNRLISTNTVLYNVDDPVMSPDGQYVAFHHGEAPIGSQDQLARVATLVGPERVRAYPGVRWIYGFSQDSRYAVGLMTNASQFSREGTLCRLDLLTGELEPFSVGQGAGFWFNASIGSSPVISADGRYIVFESPDDGLVPGDNNRVSDMFVRDVQAGTTLLVSRSLAHSGTGNAASSALMLSADGGAIVFRSDASDLARADFNLKSDLFVLTFAIADSDQDGLPDDWEMTYFGSLDRNGTGDQDGDGLTDADEYRAGTNPAGADSVLRVLSLRPVTGGGAEILWASIPGKRYRVEYKDTVTATEWLVGAVNLTPSSSTGRWTDSFANSTAPRYYRVVVLD